MPEIFWIYPITLEKFAELSYAIAEGKSASIEFPFLQAHVC
jgi:hypothetical protein